MSSFFRDRRWLWWIVALTSAAVVRGGPAQINAWLIGVGRGQVIAGQPLRIGVEIAPAEDSTEPVALSTRSDDWRSDVAIELVPEVGGSAVVAQAHGAAGPKQTTATAANPVNGLWWIPAATTGKLSSGNYQLRARWSGAPVFNAVTIEILPATTAQDPVARTLASAYDEVLGGHPEIAAQKVDALLSQNADNVDLLIFRGLLCLSVGDPVSAKACLTRAQIIAASVKDAEPSVTLDELRRRMDASGGTPVRLPGEVAAVIPAWSRPPELVFRSRGSATTSATAAAVVKPITPVVAATSEASVNSGSAAAAAVPASVEKATPATKPAVVSNYASVEAGVVVPPSEFTDAGIRAEPRGQWATSAKASSEYGAPGYAASQATGAPNVTDGGDNTSAWCPASSAKGLQWLEATFAQPVHATEVRVRQSYNPGAVVKIEATDTDGGVHLWWTGIDPARPPGALNAIAWFTVRVPRTAYRVGTVRVTLDIDAVASWQEIDAVQLVGEK